MTKRRQISLLPAIHQTEPLKRFFNSTVDQLFEEGKTQAVSGYIGRKPDHYDSAKDFYKPEPTAAREHYQLEPMMVSVGDDRTIQSQLFYEDLIARLNREGALTDDANRLFGAGYYSWAPPLDIDRLVNFSQYYWAGEKTASLIMTVPGVEVGTRYYADGYSTEYPTPVKLASRADEEEEITVLINGERQTTGWTVSPGGTQIVFSTAPTLDAVIVVFRYGNVSDGSRTVFNIPAHCPASLGLETVYVFVNGRETFDFAIDGETVVLDNPPPENSHVMVTRIKDLKDRIEGGVSFDPSGLTLLPITALINGQKVKLVDPANFTKGYDLKAYEHPWDEIGISTYYVEGVGVSIFLIPVNGDGYAGEDPQYSVMSRADAARGYWSRVNRWVHRDALIDPADATYGNRAKRPIIEFLAGTRQYRHGSYRVVNAAASLSDFADSGTDKLLFEEITGRPVNSVTVDNGHILEYGDILMVNVEGSEHNGKLWHVDQVTDENDENLMLYLLEPLEDLEEGAVTTVGGRTEYFYDGFGWTLIENSEDGPLFTLYDKDGIALDDVGVYPDSDFEGSRIFSFAQGSGKVDPVMRRRLSYDKYGQIMFENNLETTRYNYEGGEIVGYYYYRSGDAFSNSWHLASKDHITAINESNVSDIPLSLQANADFDAPTLLSRNDFFPHFESIISRQEGFEGQAYGYNNWNDTPRDPSKGLVIVQHEAPLLKLMALVERDELSVPEAIRFVEREYVRFRAKFLKHILELSYQQNNDNFNPTDLAKKAIARINAGKTRFFPFHDSLVGGDNYFIPPTPALLGITPLVKPAWVIDDTSGEEVEYLRGHDGSLTARFNDSRDNALYALEEMIYQAAPLASRPFPLHTLVSGKAREAAYSPQEFETIMLPAFERWAREKNLNLDNTQYVEGDPFTYNYRFTSDRYGNDVPGHWRGMYRWYFDTETPHLTPWEMLGFSERPYWWSASYGSAPYTRGNTILWDDIASGTIRSGSRAGTYTELARPDLMQVLPVDLTGKLLDPVAATIIPSAPPVQFAKQNWQFGDGSDTEKKWRSSASYVFALALAKYLMRPAYFVERFWDIKNTDVVHGTQTVNTPEYRRVQHADLYVHGEVREDGSTQDSLGIQNWLVDHLLHSGKGSDTLGEIIRGLSARLGHKVAGFTTKDRMTISAESFGLVPDEDITISIYNSPSLNEYYYSGMLIENTPYGYRVIGYNPDYPFFNIILPEENSRKLKISSSTTGEKAINKWVSSVYYKKDVLVEYDNVVWRCIGAHNSGSKFEESFWKISPISQKQIAGSVHKHLMSSGVEARVEYGTEFRTKQEVADLIFGYERWLVAQGFVFEEDQDSSASWMMAAKNFLKWSDVEWSNGTFMTISPAARELKFQTERGIVFEIEDALLDRTGHSFRSENYSVDRAETETVITAHKDDIYGARLTVTEVEHCLIFSNETIFDDAIYNPLYNVRQERLKLSARVARDWAGRYEAPGFVIQGNEIVPNFHKSADDIREMFDIELADNTILRDHARHLIGFESRPYLDQLLMSETQQFELYQGMIQQKGALGAMSAILRSNEIGQSRDLKFLEEWAFRIGTFGAYHPTFQMEFLVNQLDIHNEKQVIHLLPEGNADWVNVTSQKWVSPPADFDSMLVDRTSETMPDAGYIRSWEATHTYAFVEDFAEAVTDALEVASGNVLWLTHGENWDAQRLNYPTADLSALEVLRVDNEFSGAADDVTGWRVVFSGEHNLVEGDELILGNGTFREFRGVHPIARVGTDWVETDADIGSPFDFEEVQLSGEASPVPLRATPLRVATVEERDALPPYPQDTLCYVDSFDGGWAVFKKTPTNSWSLDPVRRQPKMLENKKITNALIFDTASRITDTELLVEPAVADEMVVVDPLAGLIPGIVDRELDFKIEVDPADYAVWGESERGMLWWDLSTVRFINYYTDIMESLDPSSARYSKEVEYRTSHWAKVAETSSVDVYEWTRSLTQPEDGEFVVRTEYDARLAKTVSAYYFWERNVDTTPMVRNRRLSAKACSEIIQNPSKAGLIWYAAMAKTAILMSGTRGLFADEPRIFQLEYQVTDYEGEEHSEWLLMRPGDKETPPVEQLWTKLMDSLRGFDLNLKTLPDPVLHPTQRGGLLERQSMFGEISIKESRHSFIEMLNYILARHNYSDVGSLEDRLSLGDTPPEYLYWSPHGGELALLPPRIEYNTVVYDPAAVAEALESFERVLLDNMASDNPSWSVWKMGNDGPEIVKTWDRVYATRAEMLADFDDFEYLERVLVESDEGADGFWSIWEKRGNGLWDVAPFDTFEYDGYAMGMVNAQKYRTRDFWYYADWYDESVDAAIPPHVTYETISDRNQAEGDSPRNLFVKVMDDSNYWSWYQWDGDEWIMVARESATIQLLTAFYKRDTVYGVRDNALYFDGADVRLRDGTLDLSVLVNAIKTVLLTTEEENELWFSMIHFIHSKLDKVDWATKTSFLNVLGYNERLWASPVAIKDNLSLLLQYIDEVKPYRVKIREILRSLAPDIDVAELGVTDFDRPPYFDALMQEYRRLVDGEDDDILTQGEYRWGTAFPDHRRRFEVGMLFDRVWPDVNEADPSAADRIMAFYQPGSNMREKNLTDLLSLDFKGTVYDGSVIGDTDNDVILRGSNSDGSQVDLNVEGGFKLRDPHVARNKPEELVSVGFHDGVMFRAHDRWADGAPLHTVRHFDVSRRTGSTATLDIGALVDNVVVFHDGVRIEPDHYTLHQLSHEVTVDLEIDGVRPTDITIHAFGFACQTGRIWDQVYLTGGQGVYSVDQLSNGSADVWLNGTLLNSLEAYDAGNSTLTLTVPTTSSDGMLVNVFTHVAPKQTRMQVEELEYNAELTWLLDKLPGRTPYHAGAIVEVNGLRLTPPKTHYIDFDVEYYIKHEDFTQITIFDDEETSHAVIDIETQTGNTFDTVPDAIEGMQAAGIRFGWWNKWLLFADTDAKERLYIAVINDGTADFTISTSGEMIITKSGITASDTIRVTTFENDAKMDIRTHVFEGSPEGFYALRTRRRGSPWFTLDGRRLTENVEFLMDERDMGQWDLDPFEIFNYDDFRTVNLVIRFPGDQPPTDVVITTFEGREAQPEKHWQIASQAPEEMRLLKNSSDETMYIPRKAYDLASLDPIRRAGSLVQAIGQETKSFSLKLNPLNAPSVMIPSQPLQVPTKDVPGVIWIEGERIEYFGYKRNGSTVTISELRRGTRGTAMTAHAAGTLGYALHHIDRLPPLSGPDINPGNDLPPSGVLNGGIDVSVEADGIHTDSFGPINEEVVVTPDLVGESIPYGIHQHWRVFMKNTHGSINYFEVGTLELRSTPNGPSICTGGTASARNTLATSNPANAFDATADTFWASTLNSVTDGWLTYTFPNPVSVMEVAIAPSAFDIENHIRCPKDCVLQHSDDGVTWTDAFEFSVASPLERRLMSYPAIPYEPDYSREWRLRITAINHLYYSRVAELEFRETEGGPKVTELVTRRGNSTARAFTSSTDRGPENALDNNTDTNWGNGGFSVPVKPFHYIFDTPRKIEEVLLQIADVTDRTPNSFTLEYLASDGVTWVPYKSWTGVTWISGYQTQIFN